MRGALPNHWRYWIAPSLVLGAMLAIHFSEVPILASILAPRFNRELGLLENLQHALLLVILTITALRARRASATRERLLFGVVAAAATFMFLEEVDYGSHWWHALHGRGDDYVPFSVHNTGANSDRFKRGGDAILIAVFAVYPLLAWRPGNRWIAFFRPSAWFLTSVVAMLLLSELAHTLNDLGLAADAPIRDSMSEFRELFVYYVWFLYFSNLTRRLDWPDTAPAS